MAQYPIVVIGASAGGLAALRHLVAALPRAFSAPILVVLHIGAHRRELPAFLNTSGPLPAKHAEDGELILPGHIYVAPPDRHMIVAGERLLLTRGPKENWVRPAIDPLFRSAAEYCGASAVGVVLTGKLNDGTLGLFEIKRRGGIAVVQDPGEAAYPDMPKSAMTHVAVDYCVALAAMPELLVELVNGKNGKDMAMPITPSQPGLGHDAGLTNGRAFDRPVAITCPDCGGALRKSEAGPMVKFACHIGHTYTAEIIATAQFDDTEKILRAAVRCLNERAEFCHQMAEHTQPADPEVSTQWQAASKQALDRAYDLRDLVEQDWITPEATALAYDRDGPPAG